MRMVRLRGRIDRLAAAGFWSCAACLLGTALGLLAILLWKASPTLSGTHPSSVFLSGIWRPWSGQFGMKAFIASSIGATLVAVILAAPVSLMGALHLSEFSSRRARRLMRLPIDLLAGVPSVIFGLFGVLVIVPAISNLGRAFGLDITGYSLLAGGVLLGVMITPFILSLSVEVLSAVPMELREAALALGATRWEVIRHVVVRRARNGLLAAVVLGLARAFGETIAVMMVVGNVAEMPRSLFDPAYPLPALIANNYGEMMSIPGFESAMFLAALILMLVVGGFSLAAQLVLHRFGRD